MRQFLLTLFKSITGNHPRELPMSSYLSVPDAVSALLDAAGVTRDYLARNVAMSTDNLMAIERRGHGITPERMLLFAEFSHDRNLHELGQYFERQHALSMYKRTHGKKSEYADS